MSDTTQQLLRGFGVWKPIKTFSEIEASKKTLILCDIDDTVLHHPAINVNWNIIVNNFFHIKYKERYNRQRAETEINTYLDIVFSTIPMRHTDRDGIFEIIGWATDFVFITARQPATKEFTYDNLRCLEIDPEKYAVHFSGNMGKGDYINRNFDLSKYERVIFIDDQPRNLENVFLKVFHPNLELYQFQYVREESPFDYYPLPPGFDPNLRFNGETLEKITPVI